LPHRFYRKQIIAPIKSAATHPNLQSQPQTKNPHSQIRNPKSAIRNPKSAIRNPQSQIRNPKSAIPMTPQRLAFLLSLLLSSMTFGLVYIFGSLDTEHLHWILVSAGFVVLVAVQYFILRYSLEKFIYDRIKLVYKTIHRQKLNREDKKDHPISIHGDIIGKVNREVETWASERSEEIDELKKMEVYRREFLGNVSHELKTPLFNMQGFILTLLDGGLHDPQVNQDFLQKSQKNIERMITIVEDLEVISRLETGEAIPLYSTFSVTSLVREVFEILEPKSAAKDIRLQFAAEYNDNMNVRADKEKIRTVVSNLIENSIKYGKTGGRTKVSFYDMDENYLIEISDNGVGIDEIHIPRLFERFYRVDKHRSRAQGGSGLGLAIVKHILEAHNQTINVRSASGVGSTFSFTLQKA
jgi:two-component system, OmpR family, phosphate regulon sensor histidine kinase PhoR